MKHIYIIGCMLLVMSSCTQEKKVEEVSLEGVTSVLVSHPAGDRWHESDHYLPLPVNVGEVNGKDVLILSDRIESGEEIGVKPIGAINLLENDSMKTYILTIPVNKNNHGISAEDFDEFSTVHSSAKWIIEQYMINRSDESRITLKSWENEKYALNYLLN